MAHNLLVLIVENVNFECAAGEMCRVSVRGNGLLGWKPKVKLCQPVLKCVHLPSGDKRDGSLISPK